MKYRPTLALQMPYSDRSDRYFFFRLKAELENEPDEYKLPGKMLIVSDISGDFYGFQKLLVRNAVIDARHRWTFGDGHLIILGNCFDPDKYTTEILWLIYSLEEKAKRVGGYVHFILGKYEVGSLSGNWRYSHPRYAQASRTGISKTALYDGNNTLWYWLRTKNVAEKVGNLLFVHGGIASKVNELPITIQEINRLAKSFYFHPGHIQRNKLASFLYNHESPVEYQGYFSTEAAMMQVDATLDKFGVSHIITGHTEIGKVATFFNGKVINVNTSRPDGRLEALVIEDAKFYRVNGKGKKIQIWPSPIKDAGILA